MDWYLYALSRYFEFKGRSRRREYWMFLGCNVGISFAIGFASGLLKLPVGIGGLYNLAIFIPSLAVGVRRLHDSGRSGWYMIVPILNIVYMFTEGTKGPNKYGPDPKQPSTPKTDSPSFSNAA